MNRAELVKRAYAEGAFVALQELGYEKTAAAQIAIKLAEDDDGIGALGGLGIGAGAGLGAGAGGGALMHQLMTRGGGKAVPERLEDALVNQWIKAKPGSLKNKMIEKGVDLTDTKLWQAAKRNPRLAAMLGLGAGGLALGGLAGGLAGGLSD